MNRPERVVVALTGGPEGDVLVRRAAGIAARTSDSVMHSVYVVRPGAGGASDPVGLGSLRELAETLGGTHHTISSDDPAQAVLDFARSVEATQVVVGASRRGRFRSALRAGVSDRIVSGSDDIDVLMVGHSYARGATARQRPSPLSPRRRTTGWTLAALGPMLLTVLLLETSPKAPTSGALAYLALTVACALAGGLWPAVVAAVLSSLLLNWFFTPPVHTLNVGSTDNLVALLLFVVVAVAVASVVDRSARRSVLADRSRHEADSLSMLNRALLRTGEGVEDLLDLVCDTFAMTSASLLGTGSSGVRSVIAARGEDPPTRPEEADAEADGSRDVTLLLRGRPLPAHDLRVAAAFATHLAVVLDRAALAEQAAAASLLAQGNRMRTALLAAVSHDLRTPLAGIKAAVTTLRTPDVRWTHEDREGLLGAIEESVDRLGVIVANLLDMGRLQTGAVTLVLHDVGIDDVVARAVTDLPDGHRVTLDLADDLPAARVDAGLLDRVVANLVDNALRHTASAVRVCAETDRGRIRLLVVDHGPGVPDPAKPRLFEPFQRLGDAPAGEGVGLGLAVARGLTEAMGGTLTPGDTEGGGLTMTLELPSVESPRPRRLHEVEP